VNDVAVKTRMTTLKAERLSFTVPLGGSARRTLVAVVPERSKRSTICSPVVLPSPASAVAAKRYQRGEALGGQRHRAIEAVHADEALDGVAPEPELAAQEPSWRLGGGAQPAGEHGHGSCSARGG
jgi:hypothetical protein